MGFNSGFKGLIHCPVSVSVVLMFPAGVNGQVPDSSYGDVVDL